MKTVVAMYDDLDSARDAIDELVGAGFDRDGISLVATDTDEVYARELDEYDEGEQAAEGAAVGAVAGGAIGGLWAALAGLGALAIPGIGPIIAAGPIVAGLSGAAIGAVAGGLIGALIGWGVPEAEAEYYAEGVRRGGTLVAVSTVDSRVDDATRILKDHDPVDLDRRARTWREMGWTGFDPNAQPYTGVDPTPAYDTYDARFRQHYDTYYATTGVPYNRYQQAYRYGYTVASDPRYRDRDWRDIEPEVRRDWERREDSAWEEFKDAVRHGWNEVQRELS